MTTCIQTACKTCGLDIENLSPFRKGEWRDRGNNLTCPSGSNEGKPHAPGAADLAERKRPEPRPPVTITRGHLARADERLKTAIGTVRDFERKCNAAEYTDTGEAWEILLTARAAMVAARRELKDGIS